MNVSFPIIFPSTTNNLFVFSQVKSNIMKQLTIQSEKLKVLARINESPKTLDITFVESDGSFVGGLGEPGTAVIQPAIGNAIFAATGKRCRTLPFTPENINAS